MGEGMPQVPQSNEGANQKAEQLRVLNEQLEKLAKASPFIQAHIALTAAGYPAGIMNGHPDVDHYVELKSLIEFKIMK